MNPALMDDAKQDGMFSQITKRLAKLEAFEREFRLKKFSEGSTVFAAARQTVPQINIPTGTPTTITYDTEDIDSGGFLTPGTGIFAPTVSGTYELKCSVGLASLKDGGHLIVGIYKNDGGADIGRIVGFLVNGVAGNIGGSGSINVFLDGIDDTLRVWAFHDHGSNRDTVTPAGVEYTWVQIIKISNTDLCGW